MPHQAYRLLIERLDGPPETVIRRCATRAELLRKVLVPQNRRSVLSCVPVTDEEYDRLVGSDRRNRPRGGRPVRQAAEWSIPLLRKRVKAKGASKP